MITNIANMLRILGSLEFPMPSYASIVWRRKKEQELADHLILHWQLPSGQLMCMLTRSLFRTWSYSADDLDRSTEGHPELAKYMLRHVEVVEPEFFDCTPQDVEEFLCGHDVVRDFHD